MSHAAVVLVVMVVVIVNRSPTPISTASTDGRAAGNYSCWAARLKAEQPL